MAWQFPNNWLDGVVLDAANLNKIRADLEHWGGNVDGGGYRLGNVILDGSGGFEFVPSPVTVTQGADGQTITAYTAPGASPVLRWTAGKDATAETGANAGSDFAIKRYSDAGALIDTPLAINRATGFVLMPGNVGIGVATGLVQFTAGRAYLAIKGASEAGVLELTSGAADADASSIGQIQFADAANTQANKNVAAIYVARSGATAGNRGANMIFTVRSDAGSTSTERMRITNAGRVGIAQLNPAYMLDVTGDVNVTGTYRVNGVAIATGSGHTIQDEGTPFAARAGLNFVGAGVTVTDDAANNRTIVGISGGGAGSQTPWVSDIAGGGFKLHSTGNIGIGNDTSVLPDAGASHLRLMIGSVAVSSPLGQLNFIGNAPVGVTVGSLNAANYAIAGVEKRVAAINFGVGTDAINSGQMTFYTWNAGVAATAMVMTSKAWVGIGPLASAPDFGIGATGVVLGIGHGTGNSQLYMGQSATAHAAFTWSYSATESAAIFTIGPRTPNPFQFRTNNQIRMAIASDGNVGIGTASPQVALDIAGGCRVSASQNPTGGAGVEMHYNAPTSLGTIIAYNRSIPTAMNLHLGGDGVTGIRVLAGGNVGIGVAIPPALLTLNTAGNRTTLATADQFVIAEPGNNPGWRLKIGYYVESGAAWTGSIHATANGVGAPLVLNASGGNVGIGTVSPLSLLQLHTPTVSAHTDVLTISAGTTTAVSVEQRIKFTSSANPHRLGYIGVGFDPATGADGYMAFGTGGISSVTERMRIAYNGNVGIGTANPTTNRLALVGNADGMASTIASAQFVITGAAGPGVVGAKSLWLGMDTTANVGIIQAGIYGSGWNNLALNPVGGNVGIGISSPPMPLAVQASADRVLGVGPAVVLAGSVCLSAVNAVVSINVPMEFRASKFDFSQGNVGIACDPAYPLDVNGTCRATAFIGNGAGLTGVAGGGVTTMRRVPDISRGFNTPYQNDTGKPMFVYVTGNVSAGGGITAYVDTTSIPGTGAGTTLATTANPSSLASANIPVSFWVLPGLYYKIVGCTAINIWTEWY